MANIQKEMAFVRDPEGVDPKSVPAKILRTAPECRASDWARSETTVTAANR